MDIAIDLAEKGRGRTSPNPLVGAVLVKDNKIVGRGYHHRAGEPHAEILAMRSAKDGLKGAKLYATLEPCCTTGRTPACTDAIIQSGVSEVIIGALDPNPNVNGKGVECLRKAGIKVDISYKHTPLIKKQNEIFFKYITTKRPFITCKMAESLDGLIAPRQERRTSITGAKAKLKVYSLRDEYDAVMVGVDTAIYDNPLLTARLENDQGQNPARIILDSHARLPLNSNLAETAAEVDTYMITLPGADPKKLKKLTALGVNIIFSKAKGGRIDLDDCLKWAAGFDITSIMVEGGGKLFTSFVETGLVDKYIFFIAPLISGGHTGTRVLDSPDLLMKKLDFNVFKKIGSDIYLEAYPRS